MPDINLDLNYFTHPKTLRLVGLLGRGAEVLPIRLWCWCAKYHSESGKLTGYSAQEIESVLGWWGKPGEAMSALIKVGFVEKSSRTFAVHDWSEHQGHVAALKQRAKKAAKERWDRIKRGKQADATSNANATGKQCPTPSVPSVPTESSTLPVKKKDALDARKETPGSDRAPHTSEPKPISQIIQEAKLSVQS